MTDHTPPADPVVPYRSATAFAAAINTRLKQLAQRSGAEVTALRRQFAYSRALARVFTSDPRGWVLKGGVALLARVATARHSLDIDLLRSLDDPDGAVDALRAALAVDLGDYFRFDVSAATAIAGAQNTAVEGRRVRVGAYRGVAEFARFTIDIVVAGTMTARPETLRPRPLVEIAGLNSPPYQLYPLADHVADKVTATMARYGPTRLPSSRVRDLVDLIVIARTQRLDAALLRTAVTAERLDRGMNDLDTFVVPPTWSDLYPRAAAQTPDLGPFATFAAAVALAQALLNPILSNPEAAGIWDPDLLGWRDP